jgi:hypothetical protein
MVTSLRRHRELWAGRALAVFLLVTVSVAVQPCVMAMPIPAEPPCPLCPGESTSDSAALPMPCEPAAEDCMTKNPLQAELRGAKVEPDNEHGAVLVSVIPLALAVPVAPDAAIGKGPFSPAAPGGPPIHVRYCVYLK